MADFTLYSFAESGNAYKPALMLQLCGADWQPRWVDFFNGETRSPAYRAINPMGEVPILIDHAEGDLTLSQSGVILYHLAEKFGRFGAETKAEEREILRWILFDNHKLTANIATCRFLSRFMGKAGDAETEFLRKRGFAALSVLDTHLRDRDFIVGERATIADLSCCGYLFWPADFGADWQDYPGIKEWLSRLQSLDRWASPEAILPAARDAV